MYLPIWTTKVGGMNVKEKIFPDNCYQVLLHLKYLQHLTFIWPCHYSLLFASLYCKITLSLQLKCNWRCPPTDPEDFWEVLSKTPVFLKIIFISD